MPGAPPMADADAVTGAVAFDSHSGIFTDVLHAFITLLKMGGDQVVGAEVQLAAAFLALQVLKSMLELTASRAYLVPALWRVVGGCIWYHVATNAPDYVMAYMQWMGSIGAQVAGGGSYNHVAMDNPSLIMAVGLKCINAVWLAMKGMSFMAAFVTIAFMIFGSWILLLSFIFLAAICVITTVLAYMQTIVGMAWIPFAIEPSTKFLAMPGIGMIWQAGVSLGLTSVTIGVGYGLLQRIVPGPEGADVRYAANMAGAVILISLLALCSAVVGARQSGASAVVGMLTRAFA